MSFINTSPKRLCARLVTSWLSSRFATIETVKLRVAGEMRCKPIYVTDVEETRGLIADAACNSQTKLVEPKPEMVRAVGLFHCGAFVYRFCWVNTRNRFQQR